MKVVPASYPAGAAKSNGPMRPGGLPGSAGRWPSHDICLHRSRPRPGASAGLLCSKVARAAAIFNSVVASIYTCAAGTAVGRREPPRVRAGQKLPFAARPGPCLGSESSVSASSRSPVIPLWLVRATNVHVSLSAVFPSAKSEIRIVERGGPWAGSTRRWTPSWHVENRRHCRLLAAAGAADAAAALRSASQASRLPGQLLSLE